MPVNVMSLVVLKVTASVMLPPFLKVMVPLSVLSRTSSVKVLIVTALLKVVLFAFVIAKAFAFTV